MIGLYGDLTKKGLYSVKSVYRVCVDIIINIDEWKVEGDWNKLKVLLIYVASWEGLFTQQTKAT